MFAPLLPLFMPVTRVIESHSLLRLFVTQEVGAMLSSLLKIILWLPLEFKTNSKHLNTFTALYDQAPTSVSSHSFF